MQRRAGHARLLTTRDPLHLALSMATKLASRKDAC